MEKPEDDEIETIESYEKIKRSGKLQLNEINLYKKKRLKNSYTVLH